METPNTEALPADTDATEIEIPMTIRPVEELEALELVEGMTTKELDLLRIEAGNGFTEHGGRRYKAQQIRFRVAHDERSVFEKHEYTLRLHNNDEQMALLQHLQLKSATLNVSGIGATLGKVGE